MKSFTTEVIYRGKRYKLVDTYWHHGRRPVQLMDDNGRKFWVNSKQLKVGWHYEKKELPASEKPCFHCKTPCFGVLCEDCRLKEKRRTA